MNTEVVTVMADTVPFWGTATWIWTILAVGVFALFLIASIIDRNPEVAGVGAAAGMLLLSVGVLGSALGVTAETSRSLEKQLRETVGIENLSYSSGNFTGSLDGRYVRGTLVLLEGNRYQVVELDSTQIRSEKE